jgi:hypothetical protein
MLFGPDACNLGYCNFLGFPSQAAGVTVVLTKIPDAIDPHSWGPTTKPSEVAHLWRVCTAGVAELDLRVERLRAQHDAADRDAVVGFLHVEDTADTPVMQRKAGQSLVEAWGLSLCLEHTTAGWLGQN